MYFSLPVLIITMNGWFPSNIIKAEKPKGDGRDKRKIIGCELELKYMNIIRKRLQEEKSKMDDITTIQAQMAQSMLENCVIQYTLGQRKYYS